MTVLDLAEGERVLLLEFNEDEGATCTYAIVVPSDFENEKRLGLAMGDTTRKRRVVNYPGADVIAVDVGQVFIPLTEWQWADLEGAGFPFRPSTAMRILSTPDNRTEIFVALLESELLAARNLGEERERIAAMRTTLDRWEASLPASQPTNQKGGQQA